MKAAHPDAAAPPPDSGLGGPVAQSADPIDRVVHLAPKWLVFALIACGLLVLATVVWAFKGEVVSSVAAPGVYVDNGFQTVTSEQNGTVAQVLVDPGQAVTKGEPVVEMTDGTAVRSQVTGSVTVLYVGKGADVEKGKALLGLTDPAKHDSVVALLPTNSAGTLEVGMPVRLSVSSAPPSQFGYLTGRIAQISSSPMSITDVSTFLGINESVLVAQLGDEPGFLSQIALDYDDSTPSRYQWTVGEGPPFTIAQGTTVSAGIIRSSQRPIDLVFPQIGGAS